MGACCTKTQTQAQKKLRTNLQKFEVKVMQEKELDSVIQKIQNRRTQLSKGFFETDQASKLAEQRSTKLIGELDILLERLYQLSGQVQVDPHGNIEVARSQITAAPRKQNSTLFVSEPRRKKQDIESQNQQIIARLTEQNERLRNWLSTPNSPQSKVVEMIEEVNAEQRQKLEKFKLDKQEEEQQTDFYYGQFSLITDMQDNN